MDEEEYQDMDIQGGYISFLSPPHLCLLPRAIISILTHTTREDV